MNRPSLIGILVGLGLAVAVAAWLWKSDHPADSGQAAQVVLAMFAGVLVACAYTADAALVQRANRPRLFLFAGLMLASAAAVALLQGVWLAAITPALVTVMFGTLIMRATSSRSPESSEGSIAS